jgi:hypothetical protein
VSITPSAARVQDAGGSAGPRPYASRGSWRTIVGKGRKCPRKNNPNGEKVATDAHKLGSAQVSDVSIDRKGIGRDLLPRG